MRVTVGNDLTSSDRGMRQGGRWQMMKQNEGLRRWNDILVNDDKIKIKMERRGSGQSETNHWRQVIRRVNMKLVYTYTHIILKKVTSLKSLTYLEGFKKVANKKESLQSVNSWQSHHNEFLHIEVSLLSTKADVQVQIRPDRTGWQKQKLDAEMSDLVSHFFCTAFIFESFLSHSSLKTQIPHNTSSTYTCHNFQSH